MHTDPFSTHTLKHHPSAAEITAVLSAALRAVDPDAVVRAHLQRSGNALQVGAQAYPRSENSRIFLVAFGKAAYPMAAAALSILGGNIDTGLILTKYGHAGPPLSDRIRILEAGHPVPDENGLTGAREMLGMVEDAGPEDLVLCLVSGGGSALLTAPVPSIDLAALRVLNERLLASGADIHAINTVRKHLSQVKGGRLAASAHPAQVVSLILSDVVGDDLDIIASGPTVPDPSTFADAVEILERDRIPVPEALRAGLLGEIPETPKPGDPVFDRVTNMLIGTNRIAAEAAFAEAGRLGFQPRLLTTRLTGEARKAGAELAAQAAEMPRGACWIAGGETTVTLGDSPGLGGRNQELALAAVHRLAGLEDTLLVALATDGGDGPTDAAGAVASNRTLARAANLGLDPDDFLERHDAYHFFEPLGDLIRTGPTRTNVNDLVFLFRF